MPLWGFHLGREGVYMVQETQTGERPNMNPSAYEATTRERLDSLAMRFDDHQQRLNGNLAEMWKVLNKIRDRPPTWVSGVLTAGGAIIGGLAMKLLG